MSARRRKHPVRIRSVKPEFFTDRVTGRWSLEMMAFYAALWCYADDEGRFEWEPDAIRGQLFPYKPDLDTESLLESIEASGRIERYEVDGVTYGLIVNFKKHQKPNKPVASKLPAPRTEDERSPTVALPAGEEGRGEEQEGNTRSPEARVKGDARHNPTIDLFFNLWGELRGGKYRVQPKDAAGVARLLRDEPSVSLEEIERRMRLAFSDRFFSQNGSLAWFCSKWSNFDKVVGLFPGKPVQARPRAIGVDSNGQVIWGNT
jgi:hypothetical protein